MLRPFHLILLAVATMPLAAQRLVKDIHVPGPHAPPGASHRGSAARGYVHIGERLWFIGDAGSLGAQPFVTDGTSAGTRMVAGLGEQQVTEIANLDDRRALLFTTGLWVSDGTLRGTVRLLDRAAPGAWPGQAARNRLGDRCFFLGRSAEHGWEPWITDGTQGGTRMLRDVWPGPEPGNGGWVVAGAFGGRLYFVGRNPESGAEPWSTDGTTEGTRMLRDLNPGRGDSFAGAFLLVLGNRAVFAAAIDGVGMEPWVTDGTREGTTLLADTYPGPVSGIQWNVGEPPVLAGGRLLFEAETPGIGRELWASDGTSAGTYVVADIQPGPGSSWLRGLRSLGDRAVFHTDLAARGSTLFASTGERGNLTVLGPSTPGWSATGMPRITGSPDPRRVFFHARDPIHGQELWTTDGTPQGTSLLFDGTPGAGDSQPCRWMHAIGAEHVFPHVQDGVGTEPWITDGTRAGTRLLRDVAPGSRSSVRLDEFAGAGFRGRFVFTVTWSEHGPEPWLSDGTTPGTRLLADVIPDPEPGCAPEPHAVLRDRILFFGRDGQHGSEPWATDGSEAGTVRLRDVEPGELSSWTGSRAASEANDRLLFVASEQRTGPELWATDGTPQGTIPLGDLLPGAGGQGPGLLTTIGRMHLFNADDGVQGRELWRTDGTVAGTQLVKDIWPGPAPGDPMDPTPGVLGGRLALFFARDALHGVEPWISDGTEAGTRMLLDIAPGTEHSRPAGGTALALVGDRFALFLAQQAVDRVGVWITDGTAAGTHRLLATSSAAGVEFWPGAGAVGGRVLISDLLVRTLWITDGTPEGTHELMSGFLIGKAVPLQHEILLQGSASGASGIWVTDGRPGGAHRLRAADGRELDVRSAPTASGQRAFFRAWDPSLGDELWVTDGTSEGTHVVADLEPGLLGTAPVKPWILAAGDRGRVFFNARDRAHGEEIWISDGTAAGTRLVGDIYPGPFSSDPIPLARAGTQQLFVAECPRVGRELFAVDLREVGAALARPFGSGCAGTGTRAPALAGIGAPVAGTRTFAAELLHARPLAPAALLLGRGPAPSLLAGGCSLYLQPLPAVIHTTITDPNGRSTIPLAVPDERHLVGLLLHAQALVLDPHGAWLGLLAFSNGLEILVGR